MKSCRADSYGQGKTESLILEYAASHPEEVRAVIPRPATITHPWGGFKSMRGMDLLGATGLVQTVRIEEVAAAMLDAIVNGAEKDTLTNSDLGRIGRRVLSSQT